VDDAIEILQTHPQADCVRGVGIAGQNPYRCAYPAGRCLRPFLTVEGVKEAYKCPRQALPPVYWQTGHVDAIRPATILEKHSMTGAVIYPLLIDQSFTIDIDTMYDWQNAERLIMGGSLEMVIPSERKKGFPSKVSLVLLDFDGVMTDDRVWVDEQGHEMVLPIGGMDWGWNCCVRNWAFRWW
jgi:N-acylneuraminate cytidylyltransferase